MEEGIRKSKKLENVILVGVGLRNTAKFELQESLEELKQLALTAGAGVTQIFHQQLNSINPATYIGKGKVAELSDMVEKNDCQLVIFDDELSPAQTSTLEKKLNCPVIDRTGLILDIFAIHARTKEAKMQVELAQNNYLLPRLTGQWTHLERQEGAIGARGPGETQLETDRRAVRKRIAKLEKDLKRIDSQRKVRIAGRKGFKLVATIGYTNAGKSTLLNALSGADALVEDKLFATLDTTVRKVKLNSGNDILLSDTVGFIRKLPHDLVASFKSTLSESIESDLLLHVVDASHPNFKAQIEAVMAVLNEFKIADKPMIIVFNKVDKIQYEERKSVLRKNYPDSIMISALKGDGLPELKLKILDIIRKSHVTKTVSIPQIDGKLLAYIYSSSNVINKSEVGDEIILTFEAPIDVVSKIESDIKKLSEY